MKAFGEMLLGIPEKKAPEITQPAPQILAAPAEGARVQAPPSAATQNGKASPATKAAPKSSVSTPDLETDEEDDDSDETHDFQSGWRGLGMGRLLTVAVALALLISGGLWMLEAQFKKQEQVARLNPTNDPSKHLGVDRPTSQEQLPPAGSRASSPSATASEQTPVSRTSAEPESRTATVLKPGSEVTAAEAPAKRPPAIVQTVPPMREAATEKPRTPETILPPETKRTEEAAHPAQPSAGAAASCGLEAPASDVNVDDSRRRASDRKRRPSA
jgi:hypothetical protein